MSPLSVALLAAGILTFHAIVVIAALRWVRTKSARIITELRRDLSVAGERIVLGPAPINYRGSTAGSGFPRSKGNSVAALTDRRLVVRRLAGADLEVPVAAITGVREDKWFLRSYINGRLVLVLQLRSDAEVGILVDDHAAWMAALRARLDEARA